MSRPLEPTGAVFSADRVYRYRLWRYWHPTRAPLVCLLLNPSTGDERTNDPTVTRVQKRAAAAGFGGLEVLNIFALRSTDPRALLVHPDPIGVGNDRMIAEVATLGPALCGWGAHGAYRSRCWEVLRVLKKAGPRLFTLGMTKTGQPRHPLYQPYSQDLEEWRPYLWLEHRDTLEQTILYGEPGI